MLRIIFDTNIYGLLIKEKDLPRLESQITRNKDLLVYNYRPIRNEIRDIPKKDKLSRQTRNLLLCLYDRITQGRFLTDSIQITSLARKYYDCYKNFGGGYGWNTSFKVDLMVVACASFYGLDIVYSADKKSLLSKSALKAYKHINLRESKRTPNFLLYEDLLNKLRGLV